MIDAVLLILRYDTQISKVVEQLKTQLVEKGKEINAYKAKHNIRTQEEIAMLERERAQNK